MPFIIYSSSAGSGKTHTLVNEYLSLTLPEPQRFSQVLAITFTIKAAAQMKTRILEALDQLRFNDQPKRLEQLGIKADPDRLEALCRMTGLSRTVIMARADILLTALLHHYGDYAVMTIDSFILRLVRAFSLDLELPLRFDVELSQERVTALLVERVIAQARKGHRVGTILHEFILDKIRNQQNWNYEAELLATTRQRFSDKSLTAIKDLLNVPDRHFKEMNDQFASMQKDFVQNVRRRTEAIIDEVTRLGLVLDDFAYKKSGVFGQIQTLQKAWKKEDFEIKTRLREGNWFSLRSPERLLFQTNFDETIDPMRMELISYVDAELSRFRTIWDIKRTLPTLQLLKELEHELDRLGKEDRLVPIGQFNRKVAQIIEDEVIPYIYLRIGEKFRHYLIDEFQDTNQLQWNNLFPLIENVLGEGEKSLVVGDPKQSIYRWRGGDPQIMEQDIARKVPADMLVCRKLDANYRSQPRVVEFNNRFFSDFTLDPELPPMNRFSTTHVNQRPIRQGPEGYVEVRFFQKEGAPETDDLTATAITWTLGQIKKAHKSHPEGNLNYRDMAILIRYTRDAAPLAQALIAADIPVVTSESLMLNQYQVVRAVMAVLFHIHSGDAIHCMELLAYFKGDSFSDYLGTKPCQEDLESEVRRYLPGLDTWLHCPKALSLYDLAEEICSAFLTLDDQPPTPDAPVVPLLALLDLIFVQSPRLSGDLGALLDWWKENQDGDAAVMANCQSPDGIQILTIHKAKGLEFPLVILPFADWDIISRHMGKTPNLWVYDHKNQLGHGNLPYLIPVGSEDGPHLFSEELKQEHLNNRIDNLHLLYVAFTRARSTLLVGVRGCRTGAVSDWIKRRLASEWPDAEGSDCFKMGVWQMEPSSDMTPPAVLTPSRPIHTWQNRLSVRSQAREEWLDRQDPMTEGKLLHRLLSRIRREEDLTPVLTTAMESGQINPEQLQILHRQIENLFNLPLFGVTVRSAFNPPWRIRTEVSIFHQDLVNRPDRVQFSGSTIWVLDYKRESPHPDHRPQLRLYMKLLEQCYPGTSVSGALLYIISGKIVEMGPSPSRQTGAT